MQTVRSADGTRIAYQRRGDGPPVVCLHGGSATRHSWEPLRPHLDGEFELVTPDRRGRGDSGDAERYSLGREVADLRAVLADVDGEVTVFGHSFGGLVALAAAETGVVDRLVLYEPAVLVGEHRESDLTARMRERLESGRTAEAMTLFYREGAGVPDPGELPVAPGDVGPALAATTVRENAEVERYALPASPGVGCPTLLLTGEHGPGHLRDAVRTLRERLPAARCRELDGAGHLGPQSVPERVAAAVRTFHPATAEAGTGSATAETDARSPTAGGR
jgi:pimeloyl-ACP methyl ester carboxylesterase